MVVEPNKHQGEEVQHLPGWTFEAKRSVGVLVVPYHTTVLGSTIPHTTLVPCPRLYGATSKKLLTRAHT